MGKFLNEVSTRTPEFVKKKKRKNKTLTDRAGWCQDQGAPDIMIQSAWAVRDKRWRLSTSVLPAVHHQCNMLSVIMAASLGCWVTAIKLSELIFKNSPNHKIIWIMKWLCFTVVLMFVLVKTIVVRHLIVCVIFAPWNFCVQGSNLVTDRCHI